MFDALGSARSERAAGASLPATLATTTGASSSASGTNVQEAGVDEPDVVKVAGDLLLRVRGDVLTVHDVSGAVPRLLSSLALTGLRDGELPGRRRPHRRPRHRHRHRRRGPAPARARTTHRRAPGSSCWTSATPAPRGC